MGAAGRKDLLPNAGENQQSFFPCFGDRVKLPLFLVPKRKMKNISFLQSF